MINGLLGLVIGMLLAWYLAKMQLKYMENDVLMLMEETARAQKYTKASQGFAKTAQEAARIAQELTAKAQKRAAEYKILYVETNKREQYLLKMVNESMEVTDTKRFIKHRMEKAPFEPIDYEDNRCKS